MSKKLIITEKPSVARDFARVLQVNGKRNGYIENDVYVISWCVGHLVEMVYPEAYDIKYHDWKLEDLPFLPEVYKYGVVEKAKDQYAIVNELLHREDIDTVYWAGDSGKEGQTIEENIRNFGGVRKGMTELRVWIDSQTDEDIKNGIRDAKPMSEYALLGKSGIMRAIEDYSLGINFSRALSVKYGRMINSAAATSNYTAIAVGRVMTCVLGMVVNREREIRDFNETPFFRVVGAFSDANFQGEWKSIEGTKYFETPLLYKENGFKTRENAEKLISELEGHSAVCKNVDVGVSKKRAPLLFNLAEIQSECSKIFKISPAQTLQIVQDLYERKLTTYPRTDARVLTSSVAKEITKNLRPLQNQEKFAGYVKNILENGMYKGLEKTMYTDDSKVTDHYAIIPTGQSGALGSLDSLHMAVYELIVKRFLAIFYPPAEFKTVKLEVEINNEHFFTSAKVLVKPGYMEITGIPQKKDNDQNEEGEENGAKEELIAFAETIKAGDEISVNGFEIKEGKTSPPKRYTSGTLILAMEAAGNLIEDEELRQQIKKTGIGTSATRAEILEKLVRIKYLNQNSKNQVITPEKLGEMIYEVVNLSAPSLLNPEMTANWEKGLEGIVNGTVDDKEYRRKLEDYIRKVTNSMINVDMTTDIALRINKFTGKDSKGIATRKPLGIKCPDCGGELTTTSFGYGCSNYSNEAVNCRFSLGRVAGVDVSEEDFCKLISDGKTGIIDGFEGKNKKKFKAALVLSKAEDGKHTIGFDFSNVPTEYIENIVCPNCGGRIAKTGYGYACENRMSEQRSCDFGVGEIAGKTLDLEQFTKLMTEGCTEVIKGFKSKNKTVFNAKLELRKNEEGKSIIAFNFDDIEPDTLEGVKCPDCGGDIQIKSFGYGCSNYKQDDPQSCHFAIGKIAQKKLSASSVCELLKEGRTKTIRGFKGKSGKAFDACLILSKNEEGKTEVAFDFENVEAKVIKDICCPLCGGEIVKTSFGYGCKNYNRDNPDASCKFNIGTIASVKLNDGQLKELLTDGITSLISGFKSKTGNKFEARIALAKDENGRVTGTKFIFEDDTKELAALKCPKCGENILKGHMGYRCKKYSRDEEGCKFFVGNICGVMLDEAQMSKLLTEKKTDTLAFTNKEGKQFETELVLDEKSNVVFAFSVGNTVQSDDNADSGNTN